MSDGIVCYGNRRVDVVGPVSAEFGVMDRDSTQFGDVIFTFAGADKICALGGADDIASGAGADLVDAGSGDDEVLAGRGQDYVYDGDGDGDGDGDIYGGSGKNLLLGEDGFDFIDAGSGDDTVAGGEGDDTLLGGLGRDVIRGQGGDDDIDGGAGRDRIRGGAGDDEIFGGEGNDVLRGGSGDDIFYYREDEGDSDYDLIRDWDPSQGLDGERGDDDGASASDMDMDMIALCGQTIRDFFVAKIEFVNPQVSTSNAEDDVLITLNDNTQIGVLNASDDFVEGVTDASDDFYIEQLAGNADDFIRVTEDDCPDFDCPDLDIAMDVERPFEFCDMDSMVLA